MAKIDFVPIDETEKPERIPFMPDEGTLSRADMRNFGVSGKVTGQQRKTITDVLRRQQTSQYAFGGGLITSKEEKEAVAEETRADILPALKDIPGSVLVGLMRLAEGGFRAAQHGTEFVTREAHLELTDPHIRSLYESTEPIPDSVTNKLDRALITIFRQSDIYADQLQAMREKRQAKRGTVKFKEQPIKYIERKVAEGGLPSMAVAIGLGVLTGPGAALAMLGVTEAGGAAEEQAQAGASIRKATGIGVLSGAAEVAGEMLVLPKFIKGAKTGIPLKQAMLLIAENAGQEGVTGFTQEFLRVLGLETTKGTDKKKAVQLAFDSGLAAIPENAWVGGLTAGAADVMIAPVGAVGKSIQARRKARAGKQIAQAISEMEKLAKGAVVSPAVPPSQAAPTPIEPAVIPPVAPVAAPGEAVQPQPAPEGVIIPKKPVSKPTEAVTEPAKAPEKAITPDEAIGLQAGIAPEQTRARLEKAEKRYRELKNKPVKKRTKFQKAELTFLKKHRTDARALFNWDLRNYTREELEARAEDFGIAYEGRPTADVIKDIGALSAEQRARAEVTGWKDWHKGEPVNVTPNKLLRYSLQHEARGARRGYRAGQIDLTATHKELLKFAEENLPPGEHKLVVRAAKQAVKARTPAELKKVVDAVNRMVANYAKASAILDVKAEMKKAKKAKLRPEIQKMVDDITEEFTLTMPREQTIKRMESLLEAAQREEHEIGDIPQKLIDRAREILANKEKKQLKDFDLEEIETIAAAIGNLINQNTLKNELLFSKKYRDRKKAFTSAAKAVVDRWGKKYETAVGKFVDKAKLRKGWAAVRRIAGWDQLNMDTKMNILGGRTGVAHNIGFQGLKEGNRETTEIQLDALDHVVAVLGELNIDEKTLQKWSAILGEKKVKFDKVALPEARAENGARVPTMEITVAERIQFLRFIKDPDNRAAMLADQNKGITFRRDPTQKPIKLTAADMKAIIDSASSAEQKIAQAMHDYINGRAGKINIKQRVADTWLKLMGFPLKMTENYTHRERSREHREFDPTATTHNFVTRYLERMGIFKPRAKSNAPFVIGDGFAEFTADVNRMAGFAGKALAVNDAMALVKDRGFRVAIIEGFKHGEALIKDLEKTISFYQGLEQRGQGDIETFFKGALRRAHVGALGVKPHIVLYQTVSLMNAVTSDVSIGHLYNPKHFNPKELKRMRKILNKYSPELDARERGGSYQILTPASVGPTLKQMFGIKGKKLKSIHRADSIVMELLGLAAEAEGKAKGKTGVALKEYIARRVEQIVDQTQPSWDAMTLSSLAVEARNDTLKHLLVMFSSQRNKNVNIVTNAVVDYLHGPRKAGDKATLAKKVAIPTILNATLIYAIGQAYWYGLTNVAKLFGFRPKEKDDWKMHVTGILERMLGNWLIVGDLVTSFGINIYKGIEGTPAMFKRHRGTILGDALGQAGEATIELSKLGYEWWTDATYKTGVRKGEAKKTLTFWRLVESSARSAGVITGVPLQGIMMIAAPFLPQRQDVEKKEPGPPRIED